MSLDSGLYKRANKLSRINKFQETNNPKNKFQETNLKRFTHEDYSWHYKIIQWQDGE